jgi:hypothetical protein
MPRPRLPWFKVWVGATRHNKLVSLTDREFRVWVELLDSASVQKTRGRFDSVGAAAKILRRRASEVRSVLNAGLMDVTDDGVWMHDWKDWQRWRPEDDQHTNDSDIPPEELANDSPFPHESHRNGTGKTQIKHRKTPPLARAGEDVDVDVDVDREEDVETTTTAATPRFSDSDRERIGQVREVLDPFAISSDPKVWRTVLDDFGHLDLRTEALKQADWLRRNRKKTCSVARYVEWLGRASAPSQRTARPRHLTPLAIVEHPREPDEFEQPPPPRGKAPCADCGEVTLLALTGPYCYPCTAQRRKKAPA